MLAAIYLKRHEQVPLSGTTVAIRVAQYLMVVENPNMGRAADRWLVSIRGYSYAFEALDSEAEILSFHWHPALAEDVQRMSVEFPHLHLGSGELSGAHLRRRMHVPSERIALEDVLTFAVRELGAVPRRPDWERVLRRSKQASASVLSD